MKRVYVLSLMLLFVLLGWSQPISSSQQINIKYKNGNSVQINANDIDYIEFTETTNDNPQPVPPPTPQPVNLSSGYAVDLGLSVKWASCNVGATSCEEFGDRFAWGELSPKSEYKEKTYQYYDTDNKSYMDIGTYIGGTARDVAHVRWGGGWRMPTWDELDELRRQCTWTWTKVNGVNGYIVKGKNGNSIFFPVEDKSITLWACNLGDDKRGGYYGVAQIIRFSSSSYTWNNSGEDRWKGNFIRPVCHEEDISSGSSDDYLTFVAEETAEFGYSSYGLKGVNYSLDNGLTWYRLTSYQYPIVQAGEKVMWKADLYSNYNGNFSSRGKFHIEGNIMSLLYGDFYKGKTDLTGYGRVFKSLFCYCEDLTSAENLLLPATTLEASCYKGMFEGCNSLRTTPELPATKLADYCYADMFKNCYSLTTAPELPSTTLARECYSEMFKYCISLTTAPELPATTLATSCYYSMFYGCTSLNYIKCLATDISDYGCTSNWVYDVASKGTFVKNTSMSSWKTGENGIPSGWTVKNFTTPGNENGGNNEGSDSDTSGNYLTFVAIDSGTFKLSGNAVSYSLDNGNTWTTLASNTNSPTVSAGKKIMWKGNLTTDSNIGIGTFSTTGRFDVEGNIMSLLYGDDFRGKKSLAGNNYAFANLFLDCVGLVSAENLCLPATTLANGCYYGMFASCTSLTTVPRLPATTLAYDCYDFMFGNCTSLTIVPKDLLPATTLTPYCYASMFSNCTSLTTALTLPATKLAEGCYLYMFCQTSLTTAPKLPATKLADNCYFCMFFECENLTEAPVLPARKLSNNCYLSMFTGCRKLNYIKCFATNISAEDCTYNWVQGVSSSGTFVKASSMTSWTTGNDGIPSGWTVYDE